MSDDQDMTPDHPHAHLCGWLDLPGRHAVAATFPTLAQAGPDLAPDPSKTILLYRCWKAVFSGDPDYPAQEIGDCLVAGTMIMGESIKPIEKVQVGDTVWTGEGKLARVVSTRTLRSMKPLVRIKTKGGLPLTCTADHLCLAYRVPVVSGKRVTKPYYDRCVNGGANRSNVAAVYEAMEAEWVPAGMLTDDHYLLSPASYERIPEPDDPLLSRFLATSEGRRLLGYFVGDGCASGGSVEFCVACSSMSDELVDTLSGLGFKPKVDDYGKDTPAWRIRVHSRELVDCMRRHFYDQDGVKVFPSWAIGDKSFIGGLYEADGCDTGDASSLSSTSLGVIHGLMASLRLDGINPIVGESSRGVGVYANARPLYVVKWREERQKNVIWRDDEFVCHRVKSVEFIEGPTDVYDIGVSDAHHSFVANGFAVHNCVSFGHAHAHDLLQTVEAYLGDLPVASIHRTATEFVYGESRKVSNNLGWGDGSYGAAAIKAMTTVGMVSYAELAEANEATAYTGQRAKQWGRTGPPSAVETIAGRHKLGAGVLLNSTDDMMASIQAGHPCSICSGQGFTMERDSDGFCRASGHWGHCMMVAGYRADKPGFLICQSWGAKTPSGPLALDQPSFSFWCDLRTMGHIISEGDSFALSGTPGLSPRSLPSELSAA